MSASILILASDLRTREILRRVSEEFGRVAATGKPATAIYLAAVHEPRVAVVDLDSIPPDGRSGLVSTLRARFKIAVVGIGDPATAASAGNLGLTAIAPKPLDVGKVMTAIHRVLAQSLGESAPTRDG